MANWCYFAYAISGKRKDAEELVTMIRGEGLGRVYEFYVETTFDWESQDYVSIYGNGSCAWSVYSGMIDCGRKNLLTETKRLGLIFESYGEEWGCAFQEHIIVDRGVLKENMAVDAVTYNLKKEEDVQLLQDKTGMSMEEIEALKKEDSVYTNGGFDEWIFEACEEMYDEVQMNSGGVKC